MTTTEPTAVPADEPEWMRIQRVHDGYLVSVNNYTARDVDYLVARLTKILDGHQRIGYVEYLVEDIERLRRELAPHGRDGDAAIERLLAAWPGMYWSRTGGTIMGSPRTYPRPASDVAAECAVALGLTTHDCEAPGEREWRGTHAGLPVRVIGDER